MRKGRRERGPTDKEERREGRAIGKEGNSGGVGT